MRVESGGSESDGGRGASPRVGSRRRAGHLLPLLALLLLTAVGAWARARGLTRLGLWRDDAWVALSARVGPRTATRMTATAPGFTLALRAWLGLAAPATSWWGQLVPLGLAILGPPAGYLLARTYRLSIGLSLLLAASLTASPVAITYATRLKPYAFDLLMACLLLGLAEHVRHRPSSRPALAGLAATSTVAFGCSASVGPVVVGAWAALALDTVANRDLGLLRRRALPAVGAAVGAGAIHLAWYRRLPTGIATTWHDHYLDLTSFDGAWRTVGLTSARLLSGLLPVSLLDVRWLAVLLLVVLLTTGLAAGRAAWAPALTLAASVVAAALKVAPLGTGRTDEVLYPALGLLAVLGLATLGRAIPDRAGPLTPIRPVLAATAVVAVVAVASVTTFQDDRRYPGTDLETLATEARARALPGSLIVVEARTRYLWALTQEPALDVVFGSQWLTGFTVASTQPDVFLQPSYSVEPGYTPTRWAEAAADATRVLYVATPFEQDDAPPDQAYLALLRAGWTPVEEVTVPGGRLVVLDPVPARAP